MSTVHDGSINPGVLRIAPLALSELTSAGIQRCLAYLPDEVRIDLSGHYDVGLIDPDMLPDDWREPSGRPVVAVLRSANSRSSSRARELGARAVLSPPVAPEALVASVREAHTRWRESVANDLRELSEREIEVVTMICRGKTNAEIAGELFLSPNSIKTYIRTAYRKMGVNSRSRAVLWGLQHGL